jgi:hypothetical protein
MKKTIAGFLILILAVLNIYNIISTGSRIAKNDNLWSEITANKSADLKKAVTELDHGNEKPWIKEAAPLLWWHPEEKFKATDPREIIPSMHLWYRELNRFFPFVNNEYVDLGPFNPETFRSVTHNGHTPTDDVTRLMETGGINNGYAGFELHYDPFVVPKLPPPLFWRLGRHPLFKEIQPDGPNRLFLPVEFWYHFNFNDTRWFIANHFGDWESVLFVFDVKVSNDSLTAKPVLVSTSAHGGSTWHCEKNLSHKDSRAELFDAWGTHATYGEPGTHWRVIYPDRAERGSAWETWKLMRPIVKENFYGYSGSWGETSYVYYQNAPLPPGPHFKYLPADTNLTKAVNDFKRILKDCQVD